MKYLHKYKELNEGMITSLIAWVINKLFGKYIAKKAREQNPQLYDIGNRLNDPRIDFGKLIITENPKLYDACIRMYELFYPKNNLLEDCEYLIKHFQKDLWSFKGDPQEALKDAIYNLDKFIVYLKEKTGEKKNLITQD